MTDLDRQSVIALLDTHVRVNGSEPWKLDANVNTAELADKLIEHVSQALARRDGVSGAHPAPASAPGDGWIEWHGGENPVGSADVQYMVNDDPEDVRVGWGDALDWRRVPAAPKAPIRRYRRILAALRQPDTAAAEDACMARGEVDWLFWSGGENPLPNQPVEYRRRDGREHIKASNALDWLHSPSRTDAADIVAYRALRPTPADPRPDPRDEAE
jgi:hypothetical protein